MLSIDDGQGGFIRSMRIMVVEDMVNEVKLLG